MLVPHSMSGKKVGILGLGLSGMAAARALAAAGAGLWLHDDNTAPRGEVPAGAHLCGWQDWPWRTVVDGDQPRHPARASAAASRRRTRRPGRVSR